MEDRSSRIRGSEILEFKAGVRVDATVSNTEVLDVSEVRRLESPRGKRA